MIGGAARMRWRGSLGVIAVLLSWGGDLVGQQALPRAGRVVDSASRAPIAGARVTGRVSRQSASTDASGRFIVTIAPDDTLLVQAISYGVRRVPVPASGELLISLPALVIEDLVVTATRRPEAAAKTPIQVTAVSGTEIEGRAATSAEQAVADIPGLQILPGAPTGADIAIRGINGPRVLVLIDGEPVAGSLLENRDLSRISTVAVERIEVVKGPLSALYGSDALGGVVNLITRDPTGPLALETRIRAGDLGRRDFLVGAAAGGTFAFRVDGGLREQGTVPSVIRSDDSRSRVWDLRSTARWVAGSRLAIRTDWHLLRERQRWQVSSDGFNGFNDNREIAGWVEGLWVGDRSSLRTRILVEDYTHLFRQARGTAPIASDTTPEQAERLVKTSTVWSHRAGGHDLDAGLEAARREIDSPGKLAGTASDGQVEGFLQDVWTAGPVTVQPAIRGGWNSRWGTTLTPNLAVGWAAGAVRLRGSIGSGFRGPSFKELAWDFPNVLAGYTIRGNPDLVPERSWQVALGGAVTVAAGLTVDAEVYRSRIRNLIELVDGGVDPGSGLILFTTRNVANARTEGFEANLRWATPRWGVSGGYAFLSARDLTANRDLDRRAAHRANLTAFGALGGKHQPGATITLGYTGTAPTTELDGSRSTMGALLSVGVQLRSELMTGLGLQAGVDNALDARPAGWTGLLGRRAYLGLSARVRP